MPNRYDIAANLTLADLDGFRGVLPAATQKQVFGRNVYGRKTISIDCNGQGRVFGQFKVCFGTDSSFFDHSFDDIATGRTSF
jgi:hypothetical protein